MMVSFLLAIYFQFGPENGLACWEKLCLSVLITTAVWVSSMFLISCRKSRNARSFLPSDPSKKTGLEARLRARGETWQADRIDGPRGIDSDRNSPHAARHSLCLFAAVRHRHGNLQGMDCLWMLCNYLCGFCRIACKYLSFKQTCLVWGAVTP